MNCSSFKRWSSEALDGQLSPDKEERLTTHLWTCPSCRKVWEQMKQLQSLIAGYPAWEPTLEEDQSIRAIWRPSLRPESALHLQNLLVNNWPKVFWKFRLVGVLTGSVVALILFLMTPLLIGHLQFQLEKIMHAGNPIYFQTSWPVTPNTDFQAQLGNRTISPSALYNRELHEGTRRFNSYTLNRFAEYEQIATHEDSFFVLTLVTPEGHSSIEDVLRSPRDWNLMQRFGQLLAESKLTVIGSSGQNSGVIVRSFQRVLVIG